MSLTRIVTLACLAGAWGLCAAADEPNQGPWPVPVAGWKAPEPGEHPRLFFRRADLPALRQRAETPEGKVMVDRLRALLGGGEALPTEYNPNRGKQPDGTGGFSAKAPFGQTYTLWHAAGFGMLWQLTGKKKYADLGRQCVEKALDGVRDRDDRYSFRKPGGALRAGPPICAPQWLEPGPCRLPSAHDSRLMFGPSS